MSTDIATTQNGALATGDLAARYGLSDSQLELVRTQIAPGAPNDVLELYFVRCKQSGFDPLSKMMYVINRKRNVKKLDAAGNVVKQNGKDVWESVDNWVFQTSIDGFRAMAENQRGYAGQVGPEWCGRDGKWRDVWLETEPPAAARVGILRENFQQPLYTIALWSEYAQKAEKWEWQTVNGSRQKVKIGEEYTGLWSKMPALMLAKCAEALALRKAFPALLAGFYTHDEMAQAENGGAPPAGKAKAEQPALGPAPNDTAQAAEIAEIVDKMGGNPSPEVQIEPPTEAQIMERYKAATADQADAPTIGVWLKGAGVCDLSQKQKVNGKYVLTEEERRKADTALSALEVKVHGRRALQQPDAEEAEEAQVVEEPEPTPQRRADDAPPNLGELFDQAPTSGGGGLEDPCELCGAKPGQLCPFWCENAEVEGWPEGGRPDRPEGDSTRTQRARIALMCKDAGLSDERRHQLLYYYFEPCWSTTQLSKAQASEFIDTLKAYQEWAAQQ